MIPPAEGAQPLGEPLPDWSPPPLPPHEMMGGHFCRLEPLDVERHAAALFASFADHADSWTYLPYGPFQDFAAFRSWLGDVCQGGDPMFFTIVPNSPNAVDEPAGVASYLRIAPPSGSIEVGHIHFGTRLQCTPAATEAMFLMMARAFELGYRRYEWKCDSLNTRSRSAAERLGLSYEGTFRHAAVYKGRNRDTAWYAAIDTEWPALRVAFQTWLDPANFDSSGSQLRRLRDLTAAALHQR